MGKKVLILCAAIAFVFSILALERVWAADGETLFKNMGCMSCHKPDKKAVGSSVKELAAAYNGDEAMMIQFFNGKMAPMLTEKLPVTMTGQLDKLKKLSPEDQKALAKYIVTQK